MREERRTTRVRIEAVKIIAAWSLLAAASPAQSERTPVVDDRAAEAPADPALVADVERQLAASELAVVAHGAYRAAEHGLRATVPVLRAALARVRSRADAAEELCASALLDALVRTRAAVPPEEVVPFWKESGAALVLLAQDPQRSAPALLEVFAADGRGDHELVAPAWIAAGALLESARAPGLAGVLCEQTQLELFVDVRDDGGRFTGRKPGGGSIGTMRVPDGFPPIVRYDLATRPLPGYALLVGGPSPVFWSRRVLTSRSFSLSSTRHPQDDARIAWLASLAGLERAELGLAPRTRLDVTWAGGQDLLDRVASARASLEERWLRLRDELVRQGLLAGDDERGATPCVRVLVCDDRRAPDPPLPEIPGAVVQERRR